MKLLRVLSSKDLDEINEFLGELKDGDLYKKRLKALEDQKGEINALIEVYGKANDIDRIRSNALRDEAQATKSRDEAVADRAAAKDEADATRVASSKFVDSRNREANERFSEREKALDAGEQVLAEAEKAIERSSNGLAVREQQVLADMERSVAIRTKYREAVASLKTAIEDTARVL